jgi:hypothetical protein
MMFNFNTLANKLLVDVIKYRISNIDLNIFVEH